MATIVAYLECLKRVKMSQKSLKIKVILPQAGREYSYVSHQQEPGCNCMWQYFQFTMLLGEERKLADPSKEQTPTSTTRMLSQTVPSTIAH